MLSTRLRIRACGVRPAGLQRGASLIEVLVAIVIASIGLFALAGINAASIRYTKMSQYRAIGTLMAQDIIERIRANNTTAGAINSYSFQESFADQASLGSAPSTTCLQPSDTCDTATMAEADLYFWRLAVRANLPEGSVFLEPDPLVSGAANLWVIWRDAQAGADDENPTLSAKDCPVDLGTSADKSVRCLFFRVQV